MKRKWNGWIITIELFIGFIIGILYVELSSATYLPIIDIFKREYFIHFSEAEIDVSILMTKLLPRRIGLFLLIWISSYTPFGMFIFSMVCLWFGFAAGLESTFLFLQMQMGGPVIFLASLLPHSIVYLMGISVLLDNFYLKDALYKNRIWIGAVSMIWFLIGIGLELYISPMFLQWVVRLCLIK